MSTSFQVIIAETSLLPVLFPNGYKIKLDLIIVLECHNAIYMMPIIEVPLLAFMCFDCVSYLLIGIR